MGRDRPRLVVANTSCLHDVVRPACEAWLESSGATSRADVTLVDATTELEDEETLVRLLEASGADAYSTAAACSPPTRRGSRGCWP